MAEIHRGYGYPEDADLWLDGSGSFLAFLSVTIRAKFGLSQHD